MQTIKASYPTFTLIAILIAVALALSFGFFFDQSMRLDESQSLWQTSHSLGGIIYIVAQDVHLPFYHILLHFWQQWLGDGIATARLLSLLFFAASIPIIYLLGRNYFNKSVGLFAALLFAISPFMNWFGNEARMYSLITFLALVNQYLFLRIFRKEETSKLIWFGYGLSALIGIYTHYFFILLLASQALFFLFNYRQFHQNTWKRFGLIIIFLLVALAPWAIYVNQLGLASNYRPIIPEPSVISIFNAFSQLIAGFHDDRINSLILSFWPILVLLGFLSLQRNRQFSPEASYLLFSILIPVAIAFAASFFLRPVFLSRYLIITLPSLYLLLAWLVTRYSPRVSTISKGVLAGAMLFMLLVQTGNATTPVKEDYRSASLYLTRQATAQDIIVVSAPFTIYPLDYYYRGPATVTTLPVWDRFQVGPIPAFSPERLEDDVELLSQDHQRLWLLLSYDQGFEEEVRLYLDNNFERIEAQEFSPGLTLLGYKLRYDQESFAEALARVARESSLAIPNNPSEVENQLASVNR